MRVILRDNNGIVHLYRKEAVLTHLGVFFLSGQKAELAFGNPPDDRKFFLDLDEMNQLAKWWDLVSKGAKP